MDLPLPGGRDIVENLSSSKRRTLFSLRRSEPKAGPSPEAERATRIALMRTRLLREMRARGWTRLAIVPLTKGAGATTIAMELAWAILKQEGVRVALVDLDVAEPALARELETPGSMSYRQALREGAGLPALVQTLEDQPQLALIAPATAEEHPAELLQSPRFVEALDALQKQVEADYVIYDLAPLLGTDIGLSALPLADAILVVADGKATLARDMKAAEKLLVDQPPLMGVILNKSEQ